MEEVSERAVHGLLDGHWEGDTLVVNVSDLRMRPGSMLGTISDALKVVERYTPMGKDAIRYARR
jgi:hypothetical protein